MIEITTKNYIAKTLRGVGAIAAFIGLLAAWGVIIETSTSPLFEQNALVDALVVFVWAIVALGLMECAEQLDPHDDAGDRDD